MKKLHGERVFVQSAGVHHDLDVDPFMVAVAAELDVDISRHRTKSFDEMEEWGDDMASYDMIVALSPASQRRALEYTRHLSIEVVYWPTLDPTGIGDRAADARIDLVENDHRAVFFHRQRRLHGEHEARQLAARRDGLQRPRRTAGIGRNHEFDLVDSFRHRALFVACDRRFEPRLGEL
ncbi:MAG: low molecular weight phosphatase family protein [Parvularculaceae bacterium]